MRCLDHQEIAELAFARLNAEKAEPSSRQQLDHVRQCAECRRQLDQQVELLRQLRVTLQQPPTGNQGECLDDNTLSEFLENKLDAPDRQLAEAHLARCHDCYRQLLDLYDLSAATAAGEMPEEAGPFQVVVGILANGLLRLLNSPAEGFALDHGEPVPVLGPAKKPGEEGAPALRWIQLAGGIKISVTVVSRALDSMDVQVQLDRAVATAQLTMRDKVGIIFSQPFTATGTVSVRKLRPGTYDCAIELSPGKTFQYRLQVVQVGLS